MGSAARDCTPIYQRLADGWCMKEIADDEGVTDDAIWLRLRRHRKAINARTTEHALAIMIARGHVIARG